VNELVLIADDDEDILQLVSVHLRRLGCVVVVARDGAAALSLALERRPALALIDVTMPKLDGIEVTRLLRSAEETRGLPVILLSARVQEADVARGLEAGADGYLAKPFAGSELRERVAAVLRKR